MTPEQTRWMRRHADALAEDEALRAAVDAWLEVSERQRIPCREHAKEVMACFRAAPPFRESARLRELRAELAALRRELTRLGLIIEGRGMRIPGDARDPSYGEG